MVASAEAAADYDAAVGDGDALLVAGNVVMMTASVVAVEAAVADGDDDGVAEVSCYSMGLLSVTVSRRQNCLYVHYRHHPRCLGCEWWETGCFACGDDGDSRHGGDGGGDDENRRAMTRHPSP